ncbi:MULTISPECIES: LysE family translocator [Dickeya]|uniref:Homoserine/homoserine lactone efflux protein n=1 Tax=Dickeya aquatica TaxID=1401087 RepID=A0A375A609_9GAMM|nr:MULTISPECIES: LysE family transporter [Dickeya]SLM61475.1 Homoserine/homoserine lactone efflux protein [Dickeya aquatica]
MTWHLWLVYVGVIIVLIAVPGPSALISMTHGLRYGQRRALSTVLGSASASLVLMTASALGLGAILAASASAFLVLKVVGALYLIWLGICAWRSPQTAMMPAVEKDGQTMPGAFSLYRRGFMVGISNPKDILFFAALFPNFIDTQSPQMMQFALLAITWAVLDCSIMFSYACMGKRVSSLFARPQRLRLFNRATGSLFIFAGSALVASGK